MCLTITIEPNGLSAHEVKAIVESGPADLGATFGDPKLFRRHPPRVYIHGCDLLSDDADWDADTWAMTGSGASRLANSLRWILGRARLGAMVEALWDGETARRETPMAVEDLIRLAQAGALETHTRYQVLPTVE
jgi:hypothetical protein